jgi:hypothetical protein
VNGPFVAPLLQRTLSAVYRFYDAFFYPIDDRTPPVASSLDVSIPSLGWSALRAGGDFSYRFSALTLTRPAPGGANLAVQVIAAGGDYASFEPILLTLPLPLSTPPKRADFLIATPLWPTTALRPPGGETVVRGLIRSSTAQPIADLKIQMWIGAAPLPPPGTPFTRSNANGDFLFRFPLLKGVPGQNVLVNIQLSDGAVPVAPGALSIVLGQTQIIEFQRN